MKCEMISFDDRGNWSSSSSEASPFVADAESFEHPLSRRTTLTSFPSKTFTIILLIPQEITASSFCQEFLIDIVHLTVKQGGWCCNTRGHVQQNVSLQ